MTENRQKDIIIENYQHQIKGLFYAIQQLKEQLENIVNIKKINISSVDSELFMMFINGQGIKSICDYLKISKTQAYSIITKIIIKCCGVDFFCNLQMNIADVPKYGHIREYIVKNFFIAFEIH